MNAKHLTPLAVLAAVSVAVTAWVLQTSASTVASDRRGETVIPSLLAKANDITAFAIRDGNGTLAIERRDNRFVAADSGYPIKTDAVRDVVASSAGLSFQEARTSDPARYGDLGLALPGGQSRWVCWRPHGRRFHPPEGPTPDVPGPRRRAASRSPFGLVRRI